MNRLRIALLQVVIGVAVIFATGGVVRGAEGPQMVSLGQITNGLSSPARIDVDEAGNLYVADIRKGGVVKYDRYGNRLATFAAPDLTGSGLAVSPDGRRLYVAYYGSVAILDAETGANLGYLGEGEFGRVGEIDLHTEDDGTGHRVVEAIYVGDQVRTSIRVYGADGQFRFAFGQKGSEPGQFLTVWALAVNAERQEVYVTDNASQRTVQPRVQVFDVEGNWLRTLSAAGGFGTTADGLAASHYIVAAFGSMTFDEQGRGYFPDYMRSQIRVLDLPTTFLAVLGTRGYGSGQLMCPNDIAYDPGTGRLFVLDALSRIGVYGIDGGGNPEPPHLNTGPEVPAPLSPVDGSEVASVNPDLRFVNGVDAEGDALTYDVRVFRGEALVEEQVGLPEGTDSSYATVAASLEENAEYRWTVRAHDGIEASGWSPLEPFVVNALDEAPLAPALVSPLSGEALGGADRLSWQAANDPDPFDLVTYRVQIAADSSFAELVAEQDSVDTSIALADLAGYASLEIGAPYFWRVVAVDEHGLRTPSDAYGRFTYVSTVLSVTANMPGAAVALGGNHAYAGRILGTTPLELRDFAPGTYPLVLERSGFEPFVVVVTVVENAVAAFHADLKPAIAPDDLKARPLQAGGDDLAFSGDAVPFVVDFDSDGLNDLLVAEASGVITLHAGIAAEDEAFAFAGGVSLAIDPVPGASPFVVDWDDDGRKDLLVGGADGTINLFRNVGTETAPSFAAGVWLQADGGPLAVRAEAVPAVIDFDGDGDKDLVVGSASGAVRLYLNVGGAGSPQLTDAGRLVSLAGPVAPFFVDWNGDGERELMLAASEHLYRYQRRSAQGAFRAVEVLAVGDQLAGRHAKRGQGSYVLGDRLRLFACDLDGARGKDLIVGNSTGNVRFVASHGREPVASLAPALREKTARIAVMIPVASSFRDRLGAIDLALGAGDLKKARRLASRLAEELSVDPLADSALTREVAELAVLLK